MWGVRAGLEKKTIANGYRESSRVKFVRVRGALGWGCWVERVGFWVKNSKVRVRVSIVGVRGLGIGGLGVGIFGLRWF